jgi:hypothetical protein
VLDVPTEERAARGVRRQVAVLLLVAAVLLAVAGTLVWDRLFPGPGYVFRDTQPNSSLPIGFNPCRPVEYVVYAVHAPPGTDGVVGSAIEEISDATGLEFVYRGPAQNPLVKEPSEDGSVREPVLIGWARPQDVDRLADRTAGLGGSSHAWDAERGEFEYVRGTVILDTEAAAEMLERVDGRRYVRAVVMHELGHVLGLDHVDDPEQLMYDENVGQTELGYGDREGLAALGAGRCES